jgi:serine/threonine protein kinase
MGAVYLATDEMLGRSVAIKTIRPRGLTGAFATLFRARFENEAKAVAALSHPNIVNLYDMGCEGDTPFLVMEVVSGMSLKARLQQGPLSPAEARMLGVQISRALAAAHERGIVHRDVKPANILDAGKGNWKLADFGVARIPDSSLTLTGQFLGSPAYAAPEAVHDGEDGPAGDVYSLGATLYECLAGEPPYGDRGMTSIAAISSNEDPPHLAASRADLPTDLAAAIMHAVARAPSARPSATELADEIASSGSAPTAAPVAAPHRRWKWLALTGAVLLVLVLIATHGSPSTNAESMLPAAITDDPAPAENGSFDISPEGRADEQMQRWRRVQDKLAEAEYRDAREELEQLVEQYPDDQQARQLLDRLRHDEPDRERRRPHHHKKHHDDD